MNFITGPCTDCVLHESAKSNAIPTRPLVISGKKRALLVVGEAPGYNEDKEGKSWIGYSGQLLDKMVRFTKLDQLVDVYLSNSVRCKPPQNSNPNKTCVKACRPRLEHDIKQLLSEYGSVVVLCCGGPATVSVSDVKTLKHAFQKQGLKSVVFPDIDAVFYTYHPANLHPTRKPALAGAVEAHLYLLKRYLLGEWVPNQEKVEVEMCPRPVNGPLDTVALDIETYGILLGQEQSVFHPIKSKVVDGVDFPNQIVTVSLAWREGKRIRSGIFKFQNEGHRRVLYEWFTKFIKEGTTVLGQNIKFDINFLSRADATLSYLCSPTRLRLDDVLLWGFLEYELRPERGLKEICTLFGLADYNSLSVTGKLGCAKDHDDYNLHYYNCMDTVVCIKLQEIMKERIKEKFGAKSPKLSKVCSDMRNALVWNVIELEQAGVAMSIPKLTQFHNNQLALSDKLAEELKEQGWIVKGKGSEKSRRELITRALEEVGLIGDDRVEVTARKKEVSYGQGNQKLAMSYMVEGEIHDVLGRYGQFSDANHNVTSYTKPLLFDSRKGIVWEIRKGVGMCYPSWYPIPGFNNRGGEGDDQQGGQIQGRLSCKKPAAATFPPAIQECITTRFQGGKIIGYDESQIELRVAGLLSGDPVLMSAYKEKIDLHTDTAIRVFEADPEAHDFGKTYRAWAKSLNFLVLYKGGARKFRDVVMEKAGVDLEMEFCKETIDKWYRTHLVFKQWQDDLVRQAVAKGYIELPTGWSRTFSKGTAGPYLNEICNMPIQTIAAQLTHSAQFAIYCEMRRLKLRSKLFLNIYDAIYIDVYDRQEERVLDGIVGKYMRRPPLLEVLENQLNRSIPLDYEKKVYYELDFHAISPS